MANNTALPYRPDIDGVRAIAVLSVILFHLDYHLVSGGFIGVDIFFVISGYLITRIIATEISERRFTFRSFYVRRIRRILPAFLLVIAATVIVGRILLLPDDFGELLASIKYAVAFGANLYFSKDRGYFDLASDEKPLLHIWSLSVEEQFYFVWPALLIALYFLGEKWLRQKKRLHQPFVVASVTVLVVLAFAYSEYALRHHAVPTKLYFLLQTRFGELMIGALAGIVPACARRTHANLLSLIGLCGIFVALFAIDRHDSFPGVLALLPCLSTALVLYAGQAHPGAPTPVARLLAWPPLVYVGLLSYSLYLWHWPILAFMRYVYGSYALPVSWSLVAVSLTVALSCFSYHALEKRTKSAAISLPTALLGTYMVPSGLLLMLCFVGMPQASTAINDTSLTSYGTDVCHGTFAGRCVRGDPAKTPTVLMIGDSHAASLNSFIDVVGRNEHWSAMVVTGSSCSPVFDFDERVLPDFAQKPCSDLRRYVRENYEKYDAILIASYWAFQLGKIDLPSDKDYLRKFEKTVRVMAQHSPVYVFSDVPRLPVSPLRLAHFEALRLHVGRALPQQTVTANASIRKIVESIPNAHWVDLAPSLRRFDPNSAYQGLPIYFDEQHLNLYGSTALGRVFISTGTLLKQQ
ncbi:acyltransferase family protein [Cupriavidus sp. 8B]